LSLINTYPITTYLLYLSLLLGFIPIVISVLFPKKTKNLRVISIYLFTALFTDLFLNPISKVYFNSPFIASKIFTVIEFALVSLYLFPLIQLKTKKSIFITFSSLFVVTIFTENILIKNQSFDSFSTGVSALIVLIYSIIYLFSKVSFDTNPESFKLDKTFLIVSSILIYFSGTFFIYILIKNNYLYEDFRSSYSLINALVLTTRNLIIVFAFFKSLKPSLNQKTYISSTKYSI
jgi:hypothetical protein